MAWQPPLGSKSAFPQALLLQREKGKASHRRMNKSVYNWALRLNTPETLYKCEPHTVLCLSRVTLPGNACRLHHLHLPRCLTPCLRKEGSPRPTTRARQIEVVGGCELAGRRSGSPERPRGDVRVDLDAFWQGHARQAPVAGDSEDGTAETVDSRGCGGRLLGPGRED